MAPLILPNFKGQIVAVDTESSGLHPDDGARISVVSMAWDGGSLAVPFDQGYDTWLGSKNVTLRRPVGATLFDESYPNLEENDWRYLVNWLKDQCLVWHNSKHDMLLFNAGLRGRPDLGVDLGSSYTWDTMVVCPLLWPNQLVGLEAVSTRLWGSSGKAGEADRIGAWKSKFLTSESRGRYDVIPPDLILSYAAKDAELTYRLFRVQQEMIDQGEATVESVDRAIDTALVLYYMERTGVGFDVAEAQRADRKLAKLEQEHRAALRSIVGSEPTESSMRKFWFVDMAVPVVKETDEGQAAVTQDVVRDLVTAGVPGAIEWQSFAKVSTARSMWYSNWWKLAGSDGRLRVSYRQVKSESDMRFSTGKMRGTVSSRLAAERVQLHAIPHNYQMVEGVTPVRHLFKPRKGHELWEVDVSQAEMRGVAGLARCQPLIDQFEAGADAHDATCELVFGVTKGSSDWDYYRSIAKRLNFAIVYGAGIATLIEQIKVFTGVLVTEQEAREWWAAAKSAMPEVFRLSRKLSAQVEKTRQVPLVGGQTRYFTPFEFSHKAMNAQVQGSVAVAMMDSMIEVHSQHGPGLILLQVHDSLVLEPPVNEAQHVVKDVKDIVSSTFENLFHAPFKCDAKPWGDPQLTPCQRA